MKKIAAILLFLFALVQASPVIFSLFQENSPVFVMDEEKGEDKTNSEKKDKKDFVAHSNINGSFSHTVNTAFHLAEEIQPSPLLDQLTPPPNFCNRYYSIAVNLLCLA